MRGVWVDAGQDMNLAKLIAGGFDSAYFDIRDPRVTRAYLDNVKAQGIAPGVYAAWNWGEWTGSAFATWLSTMLSGVGAEPSYPDYPRVLVDIETHDVGYLLAFLRRWRELRPKRVTDWTMEGHQAGLYDAAAVVAILHASVGICPQCYDGALSQVWDSLAMARDWTAKGVRDARVRPVYDAAHLPEWWRGYAFTQGRLP